jgi:hypothetical protein
MRLLVRNTALSGSSLNYRIFNGRALPPCVHALPMKKASSENHETYSFSNVSMIDGHQFGLAGSMDFSPF